MKTSLAEQAGNAVFWKAIQQAGLKAIFFARLIVLARLLSPDDFGLLAISMVATELLLRLTDFGLLPALIQRDKTEERHYNTAWTINLVRALTVAGVVFLAAPIIADVFDEPRAIRIIQVLAIRPVIPALASIKVAELKRTLKFRALAFITLPEALVNTLVAIVLAPALGVWAMVAGNLCGATAFLLMSYFQAPHVPRFSFDATAAKSLIQFGRWIFITGLIVVAGSSALRAVIARQLGTAELGLYFISVKLAFLPADLTSEVIGEVVFSLYARLRSQRKKLIRAFQSVMAGVSSLVVPASILLLVFAPALVEHVLGERWQGSTRIIQILATVNILGLFGDMAVPLLKGTGKPNKIVVLEGTQTSLLVLLIFFLTEKIGLQGAAFAWLPAVAVSQLLAAVFVKQILPRPLAGQSHTIISIFCISALGVLIALVTLRATTGVMGLLISAAASCGVMVLAFWLIDSRFKIGLRADLSLAFPRLDVIWRSGTHR